MTSKLRMRLWRHWGPWAGARSCTQRCSCRSWQPVSIAITRRR
jgi:hypothetical protein